MMNHYVADTHALFWYLTASPQLGSQAKQAFDEGVRGQAVIYTSHRPGRAVFLEREGGSSVGFPIGVRPSETEWTVCVRRFCT
jgi:hypothetical protein